ncbi:MAG: threonine/serine dehydratase [Caldilineaceae bacterium]
MQNEQLPVTYQLGCAGIDWVALKETLLADNFDNGRSPEQLRLSCVNSTVNVFALLAGRVIGTARVLSDGVGNAYMVDVWTLSMYRKRGIARRMIELALEQLEGQHVYLETDDAQEYYARLGFKPQGVGMSLIVGQYLVNESRTATTGGQAQDGAMWHRVAPANMLAQAAFAAADRIRPYIRATPLDHSLYFSQRTGADVHLKLENLQFTGSFKLRGAMNKLLTLAPEQCQRGVVAASSGNHGAAVAYGCRALGINGTVFVPEHASPTKLEAMRRYGIEVRQYGDDSLVSELEARRYADEHGLAYLSPYNDLDVVAGQGTIGVEIVEKLPGVEVVFISVGGGGLIAGIAAVLKAHNPAIHVVGCLPKNSPVMAVSVERGAIVDMPSLPTLSDGTAGGIEEGAVTFALCQALVDEYVLVSEAKIAAAMRAIMEGQHLLVEGAAGVAVAALLKTQERWQGKQVAGILCGGNISLETLRSVLEST